MDFCTKKVDFVTKKALTVGRRECLVPAPESISVNHLARNRSILRRSFILISSGAGTAL